MVEGVAKFVAAKLILFITSSSVPLQFSDHVPQKTTFVQDLDCSANFGPQTIGAVFVFVTDAGSSALRSFGLYFFRQHPSNTHQRKSNFIWIPAHLDSGKMPVPYISLKKIADSTGHLFNLA